MSKKKLKLFVWMGVLTDWTSGMVCVLAESLEHAFDLLYEEDSIAWSQLQGIWESLSWEHPEIEKLEKDNPKNDLTALQKMYLDGLGIKIATTHLKPMVVTVPSAFVIRGGG